MTVPATNLYGLGAGSGGLMIACSAVAVVGSGVDAGALDVTSSGYSGQGSPPTVMLTVVSSASSVTLTLTKMGAPPSPSALDGKGPRLPSPQPRMVGDRRA